MTRYVPVTLHCGPDRRIQVFGEATTNPHLLIVPVVDAAGRAYGPWMLVHGPTGCRLPQPPMSDPVDLRLLADKVAHLDWSSSDPAEMQGHTEPYQAALRQVEERDRESPFEETTGRDGTGGIPRRARPLMAHVLDRWQHVYKRNGNTPIHLEAGGGLIDMCGLAYLLAALHVLTPDAADQVAGSLADMWEAGELDEWVRQWRQQLKDNQPLTLPGVPTPELTKLLPGDTRA